MRFGPAIMQQAQQLAAFSEDLPRLTRRCLTPEHRRAGEYILDLMRAAGMQAAFDAIGNAVGRYDGSTPGAPAVVLGSHLDTVRNAGRYDGLFGILTAIACVRALHEAGKRLPFAVEVIAFGDEEGVRFGITMSGSRALAGTFDATWLSRTDSDGVTFAEALRRFGGDPDAIPALRRSRTRNAGLHRIAHRAGTGAAGRRFGGRRSHRHCRRYACAHPRHRPVGSCRHRTDEQAARCPRSGRGNDPHGGAALSQRRYAGRNGGPAYRP